MKKINNDNFLLFYLPIHYALSFLITIAIYLRTEDQNLAFNFVLGFLFSSLIVATLSIVLKGILYKKSVALPLGVIVFKYAFIGILIHMLSSVGMINNVYLVAGVGTMVPSSLIFSYLYVRQSQQNT